MNSLKRQRTNFEPDSQPQKRACSNLAIWELDQDEEMLQDQPSDPSMQLPRCSPGSSTASAVPRRCIHKIVSACTLTQATCCACLDARPDGSIFALCMDGRVRGKTKSRWQHYCHTCHIFWGVQNHLGNQHRRRLGLPTAKEDVPGVIRVNYGIGEIDIVRSMDLTLDSLKAEVARLMRCDLSGIMLSGLTSKGPHFGYPTMASHVTYVKFSCVTSGDSKVDAMEDVQYDET